MGKATAASTRNFQRRREKAIQYAIGSPNAKSVAETTAASCSVSQNACQSMALSSSPAALFLVGRRRRQTEAITTEYLCRLRSLNIVHKSGRQFLASGAGNNHQTLVERRISLERNPPVSSLSLHRRRSDVRQSDEADLGVSRFDELRRLRDIFPHYPPIRPLIGKLTIFHH